MKLVVQINASPHQYQATATAYHFTVAALNKGHEVVRVFFYHDGVLNALPHSEASADETQWRERWSSLASQHALDLVVCVSSAQRRGVFQAHGQGAEPVDQQLAAGFRIAGLGLLMEAAMDADRLVVFGV